MYRRILLTAFLGLALSACVPITTTTEVPLTTALRSIRRRRRSITAAPIILPAAAITRRVITNLRLGTTNQRPGPFTAPTRTVAGMATARAGTTTTGATTVAAIMMAGAAIGTGAIAVATITAVTVITTADLPTTNKRRLERRFFMAGFQKSDRSAKG